MLKHPHLDSVSKLNLKKDLFLDFEISMNVLKEGFYDIIVKSNEIIALALDGKEIGKFEESSDVTENKVTAFLSKGHHSLYLVYLQAIGAKGIEALYKPVEDKGSGNLIGVDTDSISFSGITQ
ncbi:MAG: hypothetical protein NTY22_09255 [Proteobacteria bacterium]|nr:hypothetical protein [Pseudomonadota bacterium]